MTTNQKLKQINEIQSVLNTLVDSVDHLTTLAKAEELEQCVYIFASLIEGTEAVFKVVLNIDIDVLQQMRNIEQSLVKIAKALENEMLLEVSELSDTVIRPEYISMLEEYDRALKNAQ